MTYRIKLQPGDRITFGDCPLWFKVTDLVWGPRAATVYAVSEGYLRASDYGSPQAIETFTNRGFVHSAPGKAIATDQHYPS